MKLIKDASLNYFSTLYKWKSLKAGPLAQGLPAYVPGRDYLSSGRAQKLKVICHTRYIDYEGKS